MENKKDEKPLPTIPLETYMEGVTLFNSLSPNKQRLLMYFEDCMVNKGGFIDERKMFLSSISREEFKWANEFVDQGIALTFQWLDTERKSGYYVYLSDKAVVAAWIYRYQMIKASAKDTLDMALASLGTDKVDE